jgi:putative proteasome-type protease
MPLDLLVYRRDALKIAHHCVIGEDSAYYTQIRKMWGARLKEAFMEIPAPDWENVNRPASILRQEA